MKTSRQQVVRKDRKKLAVALRSFLNGELDCLALMKEAEKVCDSQDPVVRHVLMHLDMGLDMILSPDEMTKQGWNHTQRLLLLLDSNAGIRSEWQVFWSSTQLLAALALVAIAIISMGVGWQWVSLIAAPFATLSWYISRCRERKVAKPYVDVLTPFGSFEQLKRTYVETPNFRKQKFPRPQHEQKARGRMRVVDSFVERLFAGSFLAVITVLPPFFLIFQVLPIFHHQIDVV